MWLLAKDGRGPVRPIGSMARSTERGPLDHRFEQKKKGGAAARSRERCPAPPPTHLPAPPPPAPARRRRLRRRRRRLPQPGDAACDAAAACPNQFCDAACGYLVPCWVNGVAKISVVFTCVAKIGVVFTCAVWLPLVMASSVSLDDRRAAADRTHQPSAAQRAGEATPRLAATRDGAGAQRTTHGGGAPSSENPSSQELQLREAQVQGVEARGSAEQHGHDHPQDERTLPSGMHTPISLMSTDHGAINGTEIVDEDEDHCGEDFGDDEYMDEDEYGDGRGCVEGRIEPNMVDADVLRGEKNRQFKSKVWTEIKQPSWIQGVSSVLSAVNRT